MTATETRDPVLEELELPHISDGQSKGIYDIKFVRALILTTLEHTPETNRQKYGVFPLGDPWVFNPVLDQPVVERALKQLEKEDLIKKRVGIYDLTPLGLVEARTLERASNEKAAGVAKTFQEKLAREEQVSCSGLIME